MFVKELKPRKALNKAFLKVKPNRSGIENFKTNLIALLDRTNDTESEEFHKNLVIDFLKKTYYDPHHFINTKGRNDLVIHNGAAATSTVGVILEAKKPTNRSEMLKPFSESDSPEQRLSKLNVKAFQELVLYYLRERITHKNLEVKHLVATNINEWFIFNATLFDRLFAQNKQLEKQFLDFEAGRLADTKTDFFYKQIAEPFINGITAEVEYTYFNIQDYQRPLRNNNKEDDHSLIALFKILSPEHLLKLPFTNDSNSLDKRFYSELLHIIGLTETKEGSKKLIGRNKPGERHTGTLLENAIIQLDSLDKLNRLDKPSQFGTTTEERLFHVALELSITWINRILFLKLLEAQLITYHNTSQSGGKGKASYSFLNLDKIKNYDDLNGLFFQVLARKHEERNEDVKKAFEQVPYLNSSLFEPTDIEQVTLFISNLKDDKTIPVYTQTVLKDQQGKKKTGELSTLEYLFAFLDAYDFSSEGSEDIQEDNKTLINASVLGLIFEKINGYKDGSFFTPGFITMYMCRETIRKAVVQKFNETKQWNCNTIEELYNKIEDRNEANIIVNSLKICDPAVGSGHFLVSALNEMIAVKNDLKILQDRSGKRLKEYQVEVVNDELIVTDEEGEIFEYHPNNKESQRIQETLFHEKQTIIENCLFGVDINPNSVKICRLRLWIELLKNAYYKNATELETLPNIDINIKCGNSLVSRFAIDADLKEALKKSKWNISSYRLAVDTYRNAESKEQKREMENLINDIKNDFVTELTFRNKEAKDLVKYRGKVVKIATDINNRIAFGEKIPAKLYKELEEATKKRDKAEVSVKEIENNKIFENAFEWRFEFPEVLNNEGDFVGFDIVIGNPPYLRVRDEAEQVRKFYFEKYWVSENQLDLYHLFIEKSFTISNQSSVHSLIVPNAFLANQNNVRLRQFINANFSLEKIIEVRGDVFEEASVDVLIFVFNKPKLRSKGKYYIAQNQDFSFINEFDSESFNSTPNNNFTVTINNERKEIISKILKRSVKLSDLFNTISGIKEYQVGKGRPPQNELQVKGRVFNSKSKLDHTYLPELRGKNLLRYSYTWENEYISYGEWLAEPRVPDFFQGDKVLIRQIPGKESLIASYIKETFVVDQTAYIAKPKLELDILFYLGVLNSRLLFWYFQNINNEFDHLFPKIKVKEFNSLPLPNIDYTNKEISKIVEEIIDNKSKGIFFDISQLEKRVDQLVYQLYDLTEEEIQLIEAGS